MVELIREQHIKPLRWLEVIIDPETAECVVHWAAIMVNPYVSINGYMSVRKKMGLRTQRISQTNS